jgi:hypothetical protein
VTATETERMEINSITTTSSINVKPAEIVG